MEWCQGNFLPLWADNTGLSCLGGNGKLQFQILIAGVEEVESLIVTKKKKSVWKLTRSARGQETSFRDKQHLGLKKKRRGVKVATAEPPRRHLVKPDHILNLFIRHYWPPGGACVADEGLNWEQGGNWTTRWLHLGS